jgi:hypothetical protein
MTAQTTQTAQTAHNTTTKRVPYIDANQAVAFLEAYSAFAGAISPAKSKHAHFAVELAGGAQAKFNLDGTVETTGEVAKKPACAYTITGPFTHKTHITYGKANSSLADKLGMAVLFEISTMWEKACTWSDNYADALREGKEITDAAAKRAQAANKLIAAVNDIAHRTGMSVYPLELITMRTITVPREG